MIQPVCQLVEAAQVVPFVVAQKVTVSLRLTASLRARLNALTNWLDMAEMRLFLMAVVKLGTPMAKITPATTKVIINSTKVKPEVFFIVGSSFFPVVGE